MRDTPMIVGVGHSCLDRLCTVETYPPEDSSTHITSISVQGGGAVATALAASARLGYCGFRAALSTFGRSASNLLVVSLKKGTTYYQALASRCYSGELRFQAEEKPVRPVQILLAAGFLILLTILWRTTG